MFLRGRHVSDNEALAIELLEAIEAARGSKGYCSARQIELFVRRRFALDKKKCQRCRQWLALAEFRPATGYALGVFYTCRYCEYRATTCPEGCADTSAAPGGR